MNNLSWSRIVPLVLCVSLGCVVDDGPTQSLDAEGAAESDSEDEMPEPAEAEQCLPIALDDLDISQTSVEVLREMGVSDEEIASAYAESLGDEQPLGSQEGSCGSSALPDEDALTAGFGAQIPFPCSVNGCAGLGDHGPWSAWQDDGCCNGFVRREKRTRKRVCCPFNQDCGSCSETIQTGTRCLAPTAECGG